MSAKTPRELGFRMPAEWEPHAATWLAWPHNPESWPGKVETVPPVWATMVRELTQGEIVHINVNDLQMQEAAKLELVKARANLEKVVFHLFPTNDAWARDHGPIFVKNQKGEKMITDWIFNKWGGKYPPWELDNEIPQKVAEYLKLPFVSPGIVMEGGSIEVNGAGLLMTTTSCLLNPNRNPHLTQSQIETYLSDYLGVTEFLWLGDGIVGDDTDGHIDDLSRFTSENRVVTVVEKNKSDENYKPLQENLMLLQKFKTSKGKSLEVIELPMPKPLIYEGQRLPASYANFYIGNAVVLVPTYQDTNDEIALEILQKEFPNRKVVGIDATDLIWGLGAFHCVTQQEPL